MRFETAMPSLSTAQRLAMQALEPDTAFILPLIQEAVQAELETIGRRLGGAPTHGKLIRSQLFIVASDKADSLNTRQLRILTAIELLHLGIKHSSDEDRRQSLALVMRGVQLSEAIDESPRGRLLDAFYADLRASCYAPRRSLSPGLLAFSAMGASALEAEATTPQLALARSLEIALTCIDAFKDDGALAPRDLHEARGALDASLLSSCVEQSTGIVPFARAVREVLDAMLRGVV